MNSITHKSKEGICSIEVPEDLSLRQMEVRPHTGSIRKLVDGEYATELVSSYVSLDKSFRERQSNL